MRTLGQIKSTRDKRAPCVTGHRLCHSFAGPCGFGVYGSTNSIHKDVRDAVLIIEIPQFCEHIFTHKSMFVMIYFGQSLIVTYYFILFFCTKNPPKLSIYLRYLTSFKAEMVGWAFVSQMWNSYTVCCFPTGQRPLLQKYVLHPVPLPRRQHTPHTREFLPDPTPPPLAVWFQPWLQVSARCLFHFYLKSPRC